MSDEATLWRYVDSLRQDYRDLQDQPTVYDHPPTSLEAMRMIYRAHPALIRGCGSDVMLGASEDWDAPETYERVAGDRVVTIAITDDGLADSVRVSEDGSTMFVKALDEQLQMATFLARLRDADDPEVLYLQSQDGNVFRSEPRAPGEEPELAMFQRHIQRDVAWMHEATGATAEAVNLWIGSSRSTTSFHHDPYENIYHVLSGSKTFTLLSPIEGLWLDQQFHPSATLQRTPSGLKPIPDPPPSPPIPWVASPTLPRNARAIIVSVRAGESLYLPAGWWHQVEQSPGREGLAVAVNYWYPAEIHAERYAYERFSHRVARAAGMNGVILPPGDEEEEEAEEADADVGDVWGSEGSGEEWDPREWGR
ncbi:hypothetical protein JCM24511_02787 [Saitozyma sp. JCM 24511]|nr:hypothetical protein JCM24511_02787 [Saitozyma sp. JCM 24511]